MSSRIHCWLHGHVWGRRLWRLRGESPGRISHINRLRSETRKSKKDPYFVAFALEHGLSIQDPPNHVPAGEEWAHGAHLRFERIGESDG